MIRRLLNSAASHFDVAVGAAIFHRSAASRARSASESLGPAERLQALDEIAALYDRPEHYLPGAPFFAAPAPITPRATHVRSLRDGQVSDWAWPSPFTLHVDAVADRYFASEPNRTAVARVHLHADPPRPVAILLHGYRAGHFGFEEQSWPVGWLFENGLDLAILALPFHGPRAAHHGAPLWPGSDPRITNEGFRQAVLDVRTLAHHLLARGAPQVGVMGMSLDGYTTSLVATIDDRLGFAVPIIPLASIAAVAERLGRLVGTEEDQAAQRAALDRAYRAVSPLSRPGRLPGDHMLVAAAEGDRITPPDHAQRLATHFGAPLLTFTGGHIAQIGRGDAFRAVGKLLERLGIWSREG